MEAKPNELWHVVGCITEDIAKSIGQPSGPIMANQSILDHIQKHHGDQLKGLTPASYLDKVLKNFDAIYYANDGAVQLVVTGMHRSETSFIVFDLVLDEKMFWRVKTARPQMTDSLPLTPLWKKKKAIKKKKPSSRKR